MIKFILMMAILVLPMAGKATALNTEEIMRQIEIATKLNSLCALSSNIKYCEVSDEIMQNLRTGLDVEATTATEESYKILFLKSILDGYMEAAMENITHIRTDAQNQ